MEFRLLYFFLPRLFSLFGVQVTITAWTYPGSITGASCSISATPIAENPAVGDLLFTATASGANNYTLTGKAGRMGKINPATGAVTLSEGQSIDYETTPSLQFVVVATESSGSNGTATITLPITDNNKAPEFSPVTNTACIKDNSVAGTTLGNYTAIDPDTGNTITYSIASGNTNTDFAITKSTGLITVSTGKTLSRARTATYTLVVNAIYNPMPHLNGSMTVSVTVGGRSFNGTHVFNVCSHGCYTTPLTTLVSMF